MITFFENLDNIQKIFWYIAIPVSLIFLIQTVMTFMGADTTDGLSADFDGDLDVADGPFQFFSFRNLINFFIGFSWTGIVFYNTLENKAILLTLSLAVGVLFVVLFFFLIKQILKLGEDNTFRIQETLGKTAEVYLTIPAEKSGRGIIQISVKGAVREFSAMTTSEYIASGSKVKVDQIIGDNLLLVSKI